MDVGSILDKIKMNLIDIKELTSFGKTSSENSKKTRKLGKEIDKCILKLVNNELGIEKYRLWLESNDILLKWKAAFNLFPLYPKLCLNTLIYCENNTFDYLDKMSMNNVINAFKCGVSSNNVFNERLKKYIIPMTYHTYTEKNKS